MVKLVIISINFSIVLNNYNILALPDCPFHCPIVYSLPADTPARSVSKFIRDTPARFLWGMSDGVERGGDFEFSLEIFNLGFCMM